MYANLTFFPLVSSTQEPGSTFVNNHDELHRMYNKYNNKDILYCFILEHKYPNAEHYRAPCETIFLKSKWKTNVFGVLLDRKKHNLTFVQEKMNLIDHLNLNTGQIRGMIHSEALDSHQYLHF